MPDVRIRRKRNRPPALLLKKEDFMITSASNSQMKNIVQLNKKSRERSRQDVFLVEG